jgi:hypothetical protein
MTTATLPKRTEAGLIDPLLTLLRERRSRRFGLGMNIRGGPLAYLSQYAPLRLTGEEEAVLAFAACGITGAMMSDWDFGAEAGGNMMAGLVGRTIGSADGVQSVAVFMINDEGAYLAKRPRDFNASEIPEVLRLVASGDYPEAWRRSRYHVTDERPTPSLVPPRNVNSNRWSVNVSGSTFFLPVVDLTLLYINALLELLNEETGYFPLDERNGYRPAGVARFARSRGGHLEDDPRAGKTAPIQVVERIGAELSAVEAGMVLQNLGLTCEALGLGGFPCFAEDDQGWFRSLGFRMGSMPLSRFFGLPRLSSLALRLGRKDVEIEYPLGLEREGQVLLRPFCPPYFPCMEAAVRAVVDFKFGPAGIYRGGIANTGWKDPSRVAREVPAISERAIDATIAYCDYVWNRYGRFPATFPPYHAVIGFQAHHLDVEFYDRYYSPGMVGSRHRDHVAGSHPPA